MIVVGSINIKIAIDKSINNTHVYSYDVCRNDNYEVALKPNKFYETENLPADCCYASQSINNIKINFNYKFNANHKADINYKYEVIGELVGKVENDEKEVWNRHYKLSDNNCKNEEAIDNICINQEANIDYNKYNELARCYEKEYGIKIDAVLKVRLEICININSCECNLENRSIEDCVEIEIPITNTVTKVMRNYESASSNKLDSSTIDVKEIVFYVIVVGLLLSGSILIIKVILRNKKGKTDYEKYECKIRKILKYYKALIVTVKEEPNLESLQIMNIDKLEDLIDLAEQNEKNIIHYKYKNKSKSKFYVIIDGYVYVYTIQNS